MISRGSRFALLFAFAGLLAGAGFSQTTTSTVLYRLDAASNYQQGCFAPCLCPISLNEDLRGTFTLKFAYSDPANFDHYRVSAVNWLIDQADGLRVTGSGQYLRGGQFALQDRLTLDLSIDGGAVQHYDSGLQPASATFPRIQSVISMNGMYCYDQVFTIDASPVPATDRVPYTLKRTIFLDGCFGPCACPLAFWRTNGSFDLVQLDPNTSSSRQDYALVDENLFTIPLPSAHAFTGFGIYSLDLANGRDRLVMDLTDNGQAPERYDSHWVASSSSFPWIDADVSMNDFFCADKAFYFHARP
jgi:hypothetical protein